ncbi:MAG: hypothetical protein ACP5D9_04215 [Mariniphaga sp.]
MVILHDEEQMNETFKIYSISVEEVRQINAAPNEPHQHDYEELIVGIEGQLEHFIKAIFFCR